jgi:DNA-binding beta-propeller fold protein YncE
LPVDWVRRQNDGNAQNQGIHEMKSKSDGESSLSRCVGLRSVLHWARCIPQCGVAVMLACLIPHATFAQTATFVLGTTAVLEAATAGSDSIVLAVVPSTASWTATANAPWLHLSNQSGTGSANVIFSFDANSAATRSGTLTIAGQTLTVTQAGSTYIATQTISTLLSSGLNQPRGLAVDSAGNVFIADSGNNAVKKWTQATHTVTTLVSAGLNAPHGVAVDAAGNVYIADSGNNAVKKWVAASSNLTTLVSSGLYAPSGVALDPSGNVYIADGLDMDIYEWVATNGNVITLNSQSPSYLCYPPSLAVDIAGNVYFEDTCHDALYEWTAIDTKVTRLQCCWAYNPTGLAVDGCGKVYVSDQADNWIWEWSPAGNNNTMTVLTSGFNRPGGVAVDGSGNLYIADTASNAIKEWTQIFLDPSPKVEAAAAGNDSLPAILPVSATELPAFAPTSDQPWLTITGVTNGVIYFSFTAANSTRTAIITVFGQGFPVIQRAPSVQLGLSAVVEGPQASSDSVVLAVYPHTNAWTATANAPWLHLDLSNQSGTGSRNVIFSFEANPGPTRTGTLTVAGQTLTVTQAASTYVSVGPATALVTGMIRPQCVAVDSSGNVYVAELFRSAIDKWTKTNNAISWIGSGLNNPQGVAVDAVDNVYFNGAGIQERMATNGAITPLTPWGPPEFDVDGLGNIYASGGNSIQVWAPGNQMVASLVSGLNGVGNVALDRADNAYFGDSDGLQEWTVANNTVSTLVPTGSYAFGNLAVDGAGNVYLVAWASCEYAILKWTVASNTLTMLASSGDYAFYRASFAGVAVDNERNVYFTDSYNGVLTELPNAFIDPTLRAEGLTGGSDSLPPILPLTCNLRAPFAPSSDSAWLTITGITNGVVSFAFTQNLGLPRTGHLTVLGRSIPVTQAGPVFTLGSTNLYEGPAAGSDSVVLAVAPNIGLWTATSDSPWLHVTTSSGTGGTNIIFGFDANAGATRTGTMTIAGQALTVMQAGLTYLQAPGPMTTLASSGLRFPCGVAVDSAGNVYIADFYNNSIAKWAVANNTITTVISSGLNHPSGVAVDRAGNVYIADTGNGAIKEWMPAQNSVTTLVSSGLNWPVSVAVDVWTNVYIADAGNNSISRWTATSGTLTELVSSGLSAPSGVATDVAGNAYIADHANSAIKEWYAANSLVSPLVPSGLNWPVGVAVDGSANVYIADTFNDAIKEWTRTTHGVTSLVSSGLNGPRGVAVDGLGNVYIADSYNGAVKELPRAFVDPTPKLEGPLAGSDTLPPVLPATENLLPPFAPTSDQPWLTITSTSNGTVHFSFTDNISSTSRTAHITLLGQLISVNQAGITPPKLVGLTRLPNGGLQFAFSNSSGASFCVLSTTNLSLPLADWTIAGTPTNIAPGLFTFSTMPTNAPQRFYRLRCP